MKIDLQGNTKKDKKYRGTMNSDVWSGAPGKTISYGETIVSLREFPASFTVVKL